jgi:hypothetical protein
MEAEHKAFVAAMGEPDDHDVMDTQWAPKGFVRR